MGDRTPFPTWLPTSSREPTGGVGWLRPLTLGEILDRAFHLLRANYGMVARAVLVFSVPCELLSAWAARNLSGGTGLLSVGSVAPSGTGSSAAWAFVPYLVALFAPALVAGPLCRIAVADALGRPLAPPAGWRSGLDRLPVCLIVTLLAVVSSLVGVLFFIVPGGVLWVMWRLALPVAAIEGGGPLRALGRSWRLVASRFWPALGLTLLALIIDYVVGQLLALIPSLIAGLIGLHWGFLLLAGASALVATVTWSFTLIAETLLYLDIRVRREGFDLAWRLESLRR